MTKSAKLREKEILRKLDFKYPHLTSPAAILLKIQNMVWPFEPFMRDVASLILLADIRSTRLKQKESKATVAFHLKETQKLKKRIATVSVMQMLFKTWRKVRN